MGKTLSRLFHHSGDNTSTFGTKFQEIWPEHGSDIKLTDFGKNLLQQCEIIVKPNANLIDLQEFMKKSSDFPIEVSCYIRSYVQVYVFFIIEIVFLMFHSLALTRVGLNLSPWNVFQI